MVGERLDLIREMAARQREMEARQRELEQQLDES